MVEEMKNILVVDDDDFVRTMILKLVTSFGYAGHGARDGAHAIEILSNGATPDVLITDIVMPRKGGLETVTELRAKYPRLKIIAVSGGGRSEQGDYLELARAAGADEIISKPIDPKQLKDVLQKITIPK
jgi:CheY-like chemotaxis protein